MAPSLSFALAARLTRGVAGMDSFVCAVCAACVCARAFVWWAGASQNYFVFFWGGGGLLPLWRVCTRPWAEGGKGTDSTVYVFMFSRGFSTQANTTTTTHSTTEESAPAPHPRAPAVVAVQARAGRSRCVAGRGRWREGLISSLTTPDYFNNPQPPPNTISCLFAAFAAAPKI